MGTKRREKLAVLGTGLMGRPMASSLLGAGYPLIAWNRTIEKAERLKAEGAEIAADPAQAVRAAEAVVVMLRDAEAVRQVLLAEPVRAALEGRLVIQSSTIGPWESRAIQEQVLSHGGSYLEAPVMGGPSEAERGALIALVGGEREMAGQWNGVLRAFAEEVHWIGPVGQASALKLALNHMYVALIADFALSLGMVVEEGVSVNSFMELSQRVGFRAPLFEKKLSRLLAQDFSQPNFPVRLVLKDVDLMLEQARRLGMKAPPLEGVRSLLQQAEASGWREGDSTAMYAVMRSGEGENLD